ncbi:MAG: PASTA domain-containing protein, partial [Propionicimonas sp.]
VLLDHLRQAREAIERGVADDPALTARMRETRLDPATSVTETVPTLAPEPGLHHTATLRFTPSTPISPNHPGVADGMPYYDAPPPLPVPSAAPLAERRSRKRRRGALSLVFLLLFTVILGVGTWYLLAGRFTATPDFTNTDRAEATRLAVRHGLQLTWAQEFSETVPSGQVTRTDPAAGERVLIGGSVKAYLSKGQERYPVPKLVGRTVDDATAALEEAHLALGKTPEVYDDTIAVGSVVSSSIEPGTMVKPSTEVDLNVSKGPAPVKIISFVGKTFDEAKAYYEKAGLVVARAPEDKFSTKIAAGSVISQDPKRGTLEKGGTITFTVSKGPELVTVPNVRLMTAEQATTTMKDAGFKVKVVDAGGLFNRVAYSDPGEGQQAPKGSTVTIYVS